LQRMFLVDVPGVLHVKSPRSEAKASFASTRAPASASTQQ
jgi:hypothetical protein